MQGAQPTASIADGYGSGTKIGRTTAAGPAVALPVKNCITALSFRCLLSARDGRLVGRDVPVVLELSLHSKRVFARFGK